MDARQSGGNFGPGNNLNNLNNNNVDTLDFVQAYIAWADKNVLSSNLGAEIKVGKPSISAAGACWPILITGTPTTLSPAFACGCWITANGS